MSEIKKCIYTKKESNIIEFNSKEHIFPKGIGGIECLDKGTVSDEINNLFSNLEMKFMRTNPLIATPKMFNSNLGRKNHKNREQIAVFEDDNGKLTLGYLKDNKPFTIDVIIFPSVDDLLTKKSNEVFICLDNNVQSLNNVSVNKFYKNLSKFNGEFLKIYDSRIKKGSYILGIRDKKWYLAISEVEIDVSEVKNNICKLIKYFLENHQAKNELELNNIEIETSQVTANYQYTFSISDSFRIYAKIAFNCLAKLKGNDYVIDSKFDNIRSAILTGEMIEDLVSLNTAENALLNIDIQFNDKSILGKQSHYVIFFVKDQNLIGIVSLFGMKIYVAVKLCENCFDNFTDGYICDWEHKKEYTFLEYVENVCKE